MSIVEEYAQREYEDEVNEEEEDDDSSLEDDELHYSSDTFSSGSDSDESMHFSTALNPFKNLPFRKAPCGCSFSAASSIVSSSEAGSDEYYSNNNNEGGVPIIISSSRRSSMSSQVGSGGNTFLPFNGSRRGSFATQLQTFSFTSTTPSRRGSLGLLSSVTMAAASSRRGSFNPQNFQPANPSTTSSSRRGSFSPMFLSSSRRGSINQMCHFHAMQQAAAASSNASPTTTTASSPISNSQSLLSRIRSLGNLKSDISFTEPARRKSSLKSTVVTTSATDQPHSRVPTTILPPSKFRINRLFELWRLEDGQQTLSKKSIDEVAIIPLPLE